MVTSFTSLVLLALAALSAPSPQDTAARPPDCRDSRSCRQLALEAQARGDNERFHDLAWRTLQTGSPRDPEAMYLLARAQSLSGRAHDALVMLGRLADMGVATDAATNDDFSTVRGLNEWPQLEAALARLAAPGARVTRSISSGPSPAATPAVSAATPAASPVAPPVRSNSRVEDALRLSGSALNPRGLAYDPASGRFVVGDRVERKLVVIDERSHQANDLVRATSASFYEIAAVEIDTRRGDLWVVSADPANDAGGARATALHKLQLVSGRPLSKILVPDQLAPARLVDVAVTTSGAVFVLDAVGARILRMRADATGFTVAATLHVESVTSLAPVDDRTIYVAYGRGISRVDVTSGEVTELRSTSEVSLNGFERIRWDRNSLVGVQLGPDGHRRAVAVPVAGGRTVTPEIVASDVQIADPAAVTLWDGSLYFVARESQREGAVADLVVRRVRLR